MTPRLSVFTALLASAWMMTSAAVMAQNSTPEPTPPTPDPAKAIQKKDADNYTLGPIAFNKRTREISFPGKVNMDSGIIEYALVHESGKAHESLLSTLISPFDLNVVLLLLNCAPSPDFWDRSKPEEGLIPAKEPKILPVSQCDVLVRWKDAEGKETTARMEAWVANLEERKPVSEGPFLNTGSMLNEDGQFLAQRDGSIIAFYLDPAALFNNTRKGSDSDDIWVVNNEVTPKKDTPVTVILRPQKAKDEKPSTSEKTPKKSPTKKR